MSMSFGLATTLATSQKLTPQMQQAIKLLQLSSLELAQEVQMKLDSNPLLERVEEEDAYDSDSIESGFEPPLTLETWNNQTTEGSDSYHSDDDSFSDSLDKLQQSGIDNNAMDNDSSPDDYANMASDTMQTDTFTSIDGGNYASAASGSVSASAYDEHDSYQGSTSASIQDYVRWQLNFKRLSDTDMLIADHLMDSMDDMGFVRLDIDELAQSLNTIASFYQWQTKIERGEIQAVLRMIQSCDPLGVGARHLSECLLLQLNQLDPDTAHLAHAKVLLSASEHLVSNNIKALTEETGLQPEDITPALSVIRRLNPAPGLAFQSRQPEYTLPPESYDIPDILVTAIRSKAPADKQTDAHTHINTQTDIHTTQSEDNVGWHVRLNPEILPKLQVNKEYANLVKRGDDSPDNQYLRDNLVDARLFIRSIEERNQNLLKVATSIVRRQQAFLLQGATGMQPLILKDIAEEVDLHESTVSRLTTNKSILTPQGLFSLKHFFSSHVSSSEGDVSSTAISATIKQLIADENPKKPLSDSRIQAHLATEGIDIARRTIAKYREAMNIGSSTQRKQKY